MKTFSFKMKYVIVFYIVFIGIYACSEEIDTRAIDQQESPYDRMGRLHNEGLDYVLEKITQTAPQTRAGGRVIPSDNEIRTMCSDFARLKGCIPITKSTIINQDNTEDFSFLSVAQQEWFIQIKITVKAMIPNQVEKFVNSMRVLEQQLQEDQKINKAEKEVLLYAMAVCRYSAQYWEKNYEKWQVEIFGINKNVAKNIRTRSENEGYSQSWWDRYKEIVWADGMRGILRDGKYYLEGATQASVKEILNNKQ